jgi:rhamnogalacturonyl hydrolase YesR
LLSVGLGLLISTAALAGPHPLPRDTQEAAAPAAFDASLRRDDIRRVADAVAGWQFSHLDDLSYITKHRSEAEMKRGWVQGAMYVGVFRWARTSGSADLFDKVHLWAEGNQYRLGDRLYHADDHAVARTYIALRKAGLADDRALVSVRAYFDAILAAPATNDLRFDQPGSPLQPTDRWSWCDALFMSPPAWFELSALTGDPRYREFANKEFWATTDYLFDKQAGLFYRDSRFIGKPGAAGEKLFWGRGNGWVMGGLVALLEAMPSDYPDRPRYEALFTQMARSLKNAQNARGYWSSSILAPNAPPEMSGTAFFVYALQRGIDMHLLPAKDYAPVVERAWTALLGAVQPDGRIAYVQQIGDSPEAVAFEDSELYGTGAFLLAASALYDSAAPARLTPP